MAAPAESLNVAMAGTVLCFESARQRRGPTGDVGRRPDRASCHTRARRRARRDRRDRRRSTTLAEVERGFTGRRSPLDAGERGDQDARARRPSHRRHGGRPYKATLTDLVDARRAELAAADADGAADRDRLDLTLGGHGVERGHLHLVTQVQRELEDIFVGMGYLVMEGPEVEDD